MTWLERYEKGEHVAVWREMRMVGGVIRQWPMIEDALAVAQVTMRRVRDRVVPGAPCEIELLDRFEVEFGVLPISLRAFYEIVGSIESLGIDALPGQVESVRALAPELRELSISSARSITAPVPDNGADGVLSHEGGNMVAGDEPLFFVSYLRTLIVVGDVEFFPF